MKITILGSGNAFCNENNYNSNFLIEFVNGYKMLFDCGSDIKWSLKNAGIDPISIDGVYISHLHADHVGGLEYLAFVNYFMGNGKKLDLYVPYYYADDLWSHTLKGGMEYIGGKICNIDDFFNVKKMYNETKNRIAYSPKWINDRCYTTATIITMTHYRIGDLAIPSFGLIIDSFENDSDIEGEYKNKVILISSDTMFDKKYFSTLYSEPSIPIIFQDCEMSLVSSNFHAHYNDLRTLDKKIKSKMWLYHYNVHNLNKRESSHKDFLKRDGFAGILTLGQQIII